MRCPRDRGIGTVRRPEKRPRADQRPDCRMRAARPPILPGVQVERPVGRVGGHQVRVAVAGEVADPDQAAPGGPAAAEADPRSEAHALAGVQVERAVEVWHASRSRRLPPVRSPMPVSSLIDFRPEADPATVARVEVQVPESLLTASRSGYPSRLRSPTAVISRRVVVRCPSPMRLLRPAPMPGWSHRYPVGRSRASLRDRCAGGSGPGRRSPVSELA